MQDECADDSRTDVLLTPRSGAVSSGCYSAARDVAHDLPMRHLPPEWAPQAAVMLTWPRPEGDFAEHFAAVQDTFVAIAVAIAEFEPVHINCARAAPLRERLQAAGVATERLRLYEIDSDDVWARDHGPITVLDDGRALHLDFRFDGWGGKFSAERDDALTRALAERGAWTAPVSTIDFVLEGGSIEVDGRGALLTTERCLLAPTRNPGLDRDAVEAVLRREFGIDRVLWLQHGDLLGDDTDGHIDTLARFAGPDTIAYQACDDRSDAHHEPLSAMAEELRALRQRDGTPYRLVPLPLPAPIHDRDGRRLPAGYANFLVVNGGVLVPTYGDLADATALARIGACFPDRRVCGVDCRELIRQSGSLHCVTMQIPRLP
jgi:agmatine/peptidylarginine deiminase